ncbi:MAG TPA: GTPase [Sedimentisphaerales bacterium]|nr:GTPase [Sedimentisphaerales bacterium]
MTLRVSTTMFAAVMTAAGTGAISTIQLFGDGIQTVLEKILKTTGGKAAIFKPGKILLGHIYKGSQTIDQVVIGCEGPNTIAINCHGNPLIVADIMKLLTENGVTPITTDQMLTRIFTAEGCENTIELEAKLAQPHAKTIEGTKLVLNQIETGLAKTAKQWLQSLDSKTIKHIHAKAGQILDKSKIAKLIIYGCKVIIAGPANTGKSTLLNTLAGRQKAIVTDIRGTTRDWISAQCNIGSLAIELFDTAGLDAGLAAPAENTIDAMARQTTLELLDDAHLVLLVLDNSQSCAQLDKAVVNTLAGKKVLTVLNKCDLPGQFNTAELPENLKTTVEISAKFGTDIDRLCTAIGSITRTADFDLRQPVCITARQTALLTRLKTAKTKNQMLSVITDLLNAAPPL